MNLRQCSDKLETFLARFKHVLGLLILIMLIVTSVLTWQNFDKQNQIIETGGFTDGKIKCVCDQDVWNDFENQDITIPNIVIPNG
jgi:hypothetical protein